MQVVVKGHVYLLQPLDGAEPIKLVFVERVGTRFPGNIEARSGTTSQEVIRALIERAQYVNWQIPCWQTRLSIWLLRGVVWLYEHRAAGLHGRRLSLARLLRIEVLPICKTCGHIECKEH